MGRESVKASLSEISAAAGEGRLEVGAALDQTCEVLWDNMERAFGGRRGGRQGGASEIAGGLRGALRRRQHSCNPTNMLERVVT